LELFAPAPEAELRAHGGRFVSFIRADCVGVLDERFELPNPAGARPLSVALPWALQVRLAVLLPRCPAVLFTPRFVAPPTFELAGRPAVKLPLLNV